VSPEAQIQYQNIHMYFIVNLNEKLNKTLNSVDKKNQLDVTFSVLYDLHTTM